MVDSKGKWANRIVGHGDVNPEELMAHPLNARIHPKAQRAALKGAIGDLGFIRSVTITKDGTVIDGHLRVALALAEHQATIPVEIVDLTEDEAREALLTLDPIGAMAAQDKEKLDALLREVQSADVGIQKMLADLAESANIIPPDNHPVEPENEEDSGNSGEQGDDSERWPLAIVLDIKERRRWEAYKKTLGIQTDKTVFLKLLEAADA